MFTNFSSVLLFFPAMHEIGISDASLGGKIGVFVVLYAMTLLPATAPPLIVTLLGPRAKAPLDRLNRLFVDHRSAVSATLCFGFGVLLAAEGVAALL